MLSASKKPTKNRAKYMPLRSMFGQSIIRIANASMTTPTSAAMLQPPRPLLCQPPEKMSSPNDAESMFKRESRNVLRA
eukprot:3636114-Amphidinium_carterae.1